MADEEIEWHDIDDDQPALLEPVWLYVQIGTSGSDGVIGSVVLARRTDAETWRSIDGELTSNPNTDEPEPGRGWIHATTDRVECDLDCDVDGTAVATPHDPAWDKEPL